MITLNRRQYNATRYNTTQHNTIQYNTMQRNTVQYSTVQYSTVQYCTVQYSTVQYNTIQHNATQYNLIHYNHYIHYMLCASDIQYCQTLVLSIIPTMTDYRLYTLETTECFPATRPRLAYQVYLGGGPVAELGSMRKKHCFGHLHDAVPSSVHVVHRHISEMSISWAQEVFEVWTTWFLSLGPKYQLIYIYIYIHIYIHIYMPKYSYTPIQLNRVPESLIILETRVPPSYTGRIFGTFCRSSTSLAPVLQGL